MSTAVATTDDLIGGGGTGTAAKKSTAVERQQRERQLLLERAQAYWRLLDGEDMPRDIGTDGELQAAGSGGGVAGGVAANVGGAAPVVGSGAATAATAGRSTAGGNCASGQRVTATAAASKNEFEDIEPAVFDECFGPWLGPLVVLHPATSRWRAERRLRELQPKYVVLFEPDVSSDLRPLP